MFNRFFNKKNDESKVPNARDTAAQKQPTEMPAGGGFFNLPPVVKQSPHSGPPAAAAIPPVANQSYSTAPRAPINPSVESDGSNSLSHTYNEPKLPQQPQNEIATSANASLFGGMEVKAPPPPVSIQPSGTGSLFSGLDIASTTPAPQTAAPAQILDTFSAPAIERTVTAVSKAKKKKRTGFRPGFGRQLSEETAAALQRGEVNEDAIIKGDVERQESFNSTSSKSSSVLAGLTVHASGTSDSKSRLAESTGSILSGLTVRHGVSGETSSNSLLSGLQLHGTTTTAQPVPETMCAVPVDNSPEGRLAQTVQEFEHSASQFRKNVDKLTKDEISMTTRRDMLETQIAGYKTDLQKIEQEQERACESEEFDKADAMNATINNVKHCITLADTDLRKLVAEIADLSKAKDKEFAQQVTQTKGTDRQLRLFLTEQQKKLKEAVSKQETFKEDETERLKFEIDRIESESESFAASMDQLNSEKGRIESSIADQCKVELEEEGQLMHRKGVIDLEIEALRKQLQEKEDESEEICQALERTRNDIDVVRSRFSRQLQRINAREQALAKSKSEIESDRKILDEQREGFEDRKQELDKEIEDYNARVSAVERELKIATILTKTLESRERKRTEVQSKKESQRARLADLREHVCMAEQQSRILAQQQSDAQVQIAAKRSLVNSAELSVPRLEQEKKSAAAQRNFKEAGRLSKELKQLIADKEAATEELVALENEAQSFESTLKEQLAKKREKEVELDALQRDIDIENLHELWKQELEISRSLRKVRKCSNVDANSSPRRSTFQDAATMLLKAELDVCATESDELQKKHKISRPDNGSSDSESDIDDDLVCKHSDLETSESNQPNISSFEYNRLTMSEVVEKITILEGELSLATEAENYDLAATLDEQLEALNETKRKLEACPTELSENSEQIKPSGAVLSEYSCLAEVNQKIEDLENDLVLATADENYDIAAELDLQIETLKQIKSTMENHSGISKDEVRRIEYLEKEIIRATEEEEYDLAASLDEELLYLRSKSDTKECEALSGCNNNNDTGSMEMDRQEPIIIVDDISQDASQTEDVEMKADLCSQDGIHDESIPETVNVDKNTDVDDEQEPIVTAADDTCANDIVDTPFENTQGEEPIKTQLVPMAMDMFAGLSISKGSAEGDDPKPTAENEATEVSLDVSKSISDQKTEEYVDEAQSPRDRAPLNMFAGLSLMDGNTEVKETLIENVDGEGTPIDNTDMDVAAPRISSMSPPNDHDEDTAVTIVGTEVNHDDDDEKASEEPDRASLNVIDRTTEVTEGQPFDNTPLDDIETQDSKVITDPDLGVVAQTIDHDDAEKIGETHYSEDIESISANSDVTDDTQAKLDLFAGLGKLDTDRDMNTLDISGSDQAVAIQAIQATSGVDYSPNAEKIDASVIISDGESSDPLHMDGLLIGSGSSGKSLLLRQMIKICSESSSVSTYTGRLRKSGSSLAISSDTTSTIGVDLESFVYRKDKFNIKEVGGPMTPMWRSYFSSSDYMIYVIDIADATKISAAVIELFNSLSSPDLNNKPVLIVLNKMDLPNIIPISTIKSILCFDELVSHFNGSLHFHVVSALTGENVDSVLHWMQGIK